MTSAFKAMKARLSGIDLSGKWAVVVGGTSGIGEGLAYKLGEAKMGVVIVGRNQQRGEEVVAEVKRRGGNEASTFVKCDAILLGNVRECVKTIGGILPDQKLNFLAVTQGIATTAGHTPTSEGVEQKLAIHYLSRMAFAEAFAPMLKKSDDPRVLTVLSAGVHAPYAAYKEDTDLSKNFSIANAANACGFYSDLGVDFMSSRHSPIKFIHAAPGIVSTNWGSEMNPIMKGMIRILQRVPGLAKSKEECGVLMASALLRPPDELFKDGKGFFLMGQYGEEVKATKLHTDEAKAFIQEWTLGMFDKLMKDKL